MFAKKSDQGRSNVKIDANEVYSERSRSSSGQLTSIEFQISLDLYLPDSKRFRRVIELYGPIDPTASSFKYYGTKVSFCLIKFFWQKEAHNFF